MPAFSDMLRNPTVNYDTIKFYKKDLRIPHIFGSGVDTTRLIPHAMIIYSSMVEPSIIGSSYANLVKMFPIYNRNIATGVFEIYESQHLDYFKVNNNILSKISIHLKDLSGEDIKFSTTHPVQINFVFRKIMK